MDNLPLEERIARICHAANRAYCQSIGDESQPEWGDAPQWQRESAINGVQFHLGCHRTGIEPSPSLSHENWLAEKGRDGWTYGPVKDPAKKEHPCCVPYSDLPFEQCMKDYLFGAIVASFADALRIGKVGAE